MMSSKEPDPPPAKTPHFAPALGAAFVTILLLAALAWAAQRRIKAEAYGLASMNLAWLSHGTALQRHMFSLPHALPLYGSSELSIDQPTRADHFFAGDHSGFTPVLVGQGGDKCLIILQELAALGTAARGKRVVIFISPVWFTPPPTMHEHVLHRAFAASFSPIHAGLLALESPLSKSLKSAIASRLLDYREIIEEHSPLLAATIAGLQKRNWDERLLFYVLQPIAALQTATLCYQDEMEVFNPSGAGRSVAKAEERYRRRSKPLDWERLAHDVDLETARHGEGTFYCFDLPPRRPPADPEAHSHAPFVPDEDAEFLRRMNASTEWTDFELLLRVLKESKAKALLINQPINGLVSNSEGVSRDARSEYYKKVRTMADACGIPVKDFAAYETDRTFFSDVVHPSAKAWIYYDRALDEFYRAKHG